MKFCWAVSEELRWQEKQDWRTDWLTDWLTDRRVKNIIPSATRCVGYNKEGCYDEGWVSFPLSSQIKPQGLTSGG